MILHIIIHKYTEKVDCIFHLDYQSLNSWGKIHNYSTPRRICLSEAVKICTWSSNEDDVDFDVDLIENESFGENNNPLRDEENELQRQI